MDIQPQPHAKAVLYAEQALDHSDGDSFEAEDDLGIDELPSDFKWGSDDALGAHDRIAPSDHEPFFDEESDLNESGGSDVVYASKTQHRQHQGPPSVFTKLEEYGLLRKITDIVLAKAQVPPHLRADATQEIHVTWASLEANPDYEKNQLGRYAYMSGEHAALKLRRTLGAVVVIPGTLFRSGRNSFFMESIGAALSPKDVEEYRDSLELSTETNWLDYSRVSESYLRARLAGITLSTKQRTVAAMAIVERISVDEIAERLDMPVMYVERLLNQVTSKLKHKDGIPSRGTSKCKALAKKKRARAPKAPAEGSSES